MWALNEQPSINRRARKTKNKKENNNPNTDPKENTYLQKASNIFRKQNILGAEDKNKEGKGYNEYD